MSGIRDFDQYCGQCPSVATFEINLWLFCANSRNYHPFFNTIDILNLSSWIYRGRPGRRAAGTARPPSFRHLLTFGKNLLNLIGAVSRYEASNDSHCPISDGLSFSMDRRIPSISECSDLKIRKRYFLQGAECQPDKPGLNIEEWRLNICGCRFALSFLWWKHSLNNQYSIICPNQPHSQMSAMTSKNF